MRRPGVLVPALLAVALSLPARAEEPTKTECISSNEAAGPLRKAGKLQAARKQLLACVSRSCPEMVRADCAERLAEIEKAIPTIAFTVKGPDGADVTAVRVTVDGAPLVDRLGGTPLAVDPGEHTFGLTVAGHAPITRSLLIVEGVKGRHEVVVLAAATPVATTTSPPALPVQGGRIVIVADAAATVSVDGAAVGHGRYEGRHGPGAHTIEVTRAGKKPHRTTVDLREGEVRALEVTLEDEKKGSILPYVIGGAIVVAAGATVGGFLLFKPADEKAPPPSGKLGTTSFKAVGF